MRYTLKQYSVVVTVLTVANVKSYIAKLQT